ncbi:MAG: B12-binding domain-containing radical SAM protein [Desulfobacterota bacterium]|nr:B12-binding domain-containing radical SAM protein [Thermodesulfobacteriota bacterium]
MRILLIVPRWPEKSFWDVIAFKFPLLSTSLLAGLTPPRHQVHIVDESLSPIDFDQEVDLVAITAITPLAPRAYEIADEFRRRGRKVVIGGIHASWLPEEAKAHCDSVAIGEADETWPEILADAEADDLKPFYRQKGRTDLSRLSLPRRDLLPKKGYLFHNLIQTTRGCPFDCEFCSVTALHGRTYRTRPVSEVEKEIQSLERSKAYIFFVDDNLFGHLGHARELLTLLSHYRLRWVSQGPIHIAEDEEILGLMAKAGCHGLFIGFESLREENLDLMGKRINRVGRYEQAIRKLHDQGIGVYASFVFGYDFDDESVFDEFLQFADRNRIDGAFLPILTPFPGTRIYQRLKQEGRLLTEDWSKYDMATVVFRPKRMTVEQLQEGFWRVNRSFYSLPSMLKRIFHPFQWRRSLIIFGPMNLGLWPAVKKAEGYCRR